ncbi:MAG: hypothetical protein QM831_26680 [Kofleriaceae bacterium]
MKVRILAVVAAMAGPVYADDDVGSGAPPPDPLVELKKQVAELQATVTELQATQDATAATPAQEPMFDLHGFIDMGLQKVYATDPAGFESTAATFVLGNINLYFGFHPAPHWSALAEVRFTNEPNGTALDPANGIGDDTVRWGAIVLERAYIQYEHSRELGLRVGEFLTPFGIWNVDHGSPTVIPIVRPESMTQELFPQHQVGVELYGENPDLLPGRWTGGYYAYVSNGRTPGDVDTTDDKMVGGRLEATCTHPYQMKFGISAMYGTYSDATATTAEQVAYDEEGISGDGSIDFTNLRLRLEVTYRDVNYAMGKHPIEDGLYIPNQNIFNSYVVAAYRIPETRYEPYVYAELYHHNDDDGDFQAGSSAGMNVYFTPSIQLKLQAMYNRFYADRTHVYTGVHESFLGAKLVMGL